MSDVYIQCDEYALALVGRVSLLEQLSAREKANVNIGYSVYDIVNFSQLPLFLPI